MAVIAGVHAVADLGAAAKEIQVGYTKYAADLAKDVSKETGEVIRKYEIATGRLAAIAPSPTS